MCMQPTCMVCSYQLRGALTQLLACTQSFLVKSDAASWRQWSWRPAPAISTAYALVMCTRVLENYQGSLPLHRSDRQTDRSTLHWRCMHTSTQTSTHLHACIGAACERFSEHLVGLLTLLPSPPTPPQLRPPLSCRVACNGWEWCEKQQGKCDI